MYSGFRTGGGGAGLKIYFYVARSSYIPLNICHSHFCTGQLAYLSDERIRLKAIINFIYFSLPAFLFSVQLLNKCVKEETQKNLIYLVVGPLRGVLMFNSLSHFEKRLLFIKEKNVRIKTNKTKINH